jgi:hypothetical protein
VQGNPANVDSPWMLAYISWMTSVSSFATTRTV